MNRPAYQSFAIVIGVMSTSKVSSVVTTISGASHTVSSVDTTSILVVSRVGPGTTVSATLYASRIKVNTDSNEKF